MKRFAWSLASLIVAVSLAVRPASADPVTICGIFGCQTIEPPPAPTPTPESEAPAGEAQVCVSGAFSSHCTTVPAEPCDPEVGCQPSAGFEGADWFGRAIRWGMMALRVMDQLKR
jgi:hypothetical protein